MLLLEPLLLFRRPLLLVFLLEDHMQVRTDLMEQFGVLDLLWHFGDVVELPVEPLLDKVNLLSFDVFSQDVDYLHLLGEFAAR